MSITGHFDVDLTPQNDANSPAGRMIINKVYHGPMTGSGMGQMISKKTDRGASVYYAIEEFSGSINGQSGGFTLLHHGFMDANTHSLDVKILEGSGFGALENMKGTMEIVQSESEHTYVLTLNY